MDFKRYSAPGINFYVGELGAGLACKAHGFKHIGFAPKYHGIDDIVEDSAGNLIIVEAKGGAAGLARNATRQQMSQKWIKEKIATLSNGSLEDQAWAKKLIAAQGPPSKLKGMVVTTKVDGADAFVPEAELKDWTQIGRFDW